MKTLNLETLEHLAGSLTFETVPLDKDHSVVIREMTGLEQSLFDSIMVEGIEPNTEEGKKTKVSVVGLDRSKRALVALSLWDENVDQRMFEGVPLEQAMERVGKWRGKIIQKVYAAAIRLNNMMASQQEATAKN